MQIPADSLADIEQQLPEPFSLWRKLLALGLIFFCGSFNLTILQNLKDSIVVTTAGAETLPYLSAFGVLPASLGFFMLYNKITAKLPAKWVFAATVAPLTAFYALFATVLYPMSAALHPSAAAAAVSASLWCPLLMPGCEWPPPRSCPHTVWQLHAPVLGLACWDMDGVHALKPCCPVAASRHPTKLCSRKCKSKCDVTLA